MKFGRTIAVAMVVPAVARLLVACADDAMVAAQDAGPAEFDASIAVDAPAEDVIDAGRDAGELADGPTDGGIPCSADGFCHTQLPGRETFDAGDLAPNLPVSFDIVDISVVSGTSAWAVTAGGHLLEWRGEAWSVAYVASGALTKVWAAGTDDVWIAGYNGLVLHGTRSAGAPLTFQDASMGGFYPILGIAGIAGETPASDELYVYAGNVLYRRVTAEDGGGSWGVTPNPIGVTGTYPSVQLTDMWRGASGQIWLAGLESNGCWFGCTYISRPVLWRRTVVASVPTFERLQVGNDGAVNYVGVVAGTERAGKPLVCTGQPCSSVVSVSEDGSTTAEATGLTEGSIEAAWASGPNDAWLVGTPGVIRHWNGTEWTYARVSVTSAPIVKPLHAVSGVTSASGVIDMWIVGKDTALHRTVKP